MLSFRHIRHFDPFSEPVANGGQQGQRLSSDLGLPKVHARPTLSSTPRQEPPAGHLARFFGKARFLPKVFLQYGFEGASTQAAFRTSRDVRLSPDTAQRMPSSAIVSSATSATCRLSSVSTVVFQPPCANQPTEMIATTTVVIGNDHHSPAACRLVCLERM